MTGLTKTLLVAAGSSLLTALLFITTMPDPTTEVAPTKRSAPADTPADDQAAYNELAALLEIERQTREALEYEVEWLQAMLDESVTAAPAQSPPPAAKTGRRGNTELWFDDNALLSLGVDETDVALIKEVFNRAEMDKLYLRNQAARTGKPRGKAFMQQIREIQQNLQLQLSAENYDRMLYASGQTNRVEVSDTLTSSPAATAGIQRGDQILSYGGDRIYSPTALYQATTKGQAGELVNVEILRGDERMTLYVPRGPLGTRFRPTRGKPQ